MKRPAFPAARRLWPAFSLALCLAVAGALEAQRCWSCVLGPWSPQGDCVSLSYDGYYECVQTSQYCAGVLPHCFSGSGMLAADGSVYALRDDGEGGDSVNMGDAGDDPSGPAVGIGAERRACDGAVVSRAYPASVAEELRRRSRRLRI